MQLQGELCKYWIIWFNGQTKNNHGQKKFQLNRLEIKAKGGGLAKENKNKGGNICLYSSKSAVLYFCPEKEKNAHKINIIFLNLAFSPFLCFGFFFFIISLHQISCHTKVDLVSLENVFPSANLLLKKTLLRSTSRKNCTVLTREIQWPDFCLRKKNQVFR